VALSEKDNFLIEKRILGQLNEDEQQQFNVRLNDPLFVKELEVQMDVKRAAQSFERDGLRNLMRQQEQDRSPAVRSIASQRYRRILAWSAAAVLLLIIALLFLLPQAPGISYDSLYTNYYEPFPNIVSPITKGDSEDLNGYRAYETAEYERAIDFFLRQPDPNYRSRFYLAQSYLASSDFNNAEGLLETLAREDHDLQIPSQWYLALVYLRKKEPKATIRILKELAETTHPLAKKAQQLIKDMEGE